MKTAVYLDQSRNEVVVPHFSYSRLAADMNPPQQGKLRVWQSPHTKSIMLQPLNLTPDFVQKDTWEVLKFRLADCNHDPAWWIEVPEQFNKGTQFDYFFNCKVHKDNVTKPIDGGILALIEERWDAAILAIKENMDSDGVAAIQSTNSQPPNQGYSLAWYQEGRSADRVGIVFAFYFGDFALRLSSDGQADLFQLADPQDPTSPMGYVYAFPWARTDQIHGRAHRLLILPHARNAIEFIAGTGAAYQPTPYEWSQQTQGVHGGGLYRIPGEVVKDAGGGYTITQPGKWGLVITRKYRPYIQVARVGYNDGTDKVAGFWDSPAQSLYPLSKPVISALDIDANGCTSTSDVQVDAVKKTAQLYVTMKGLADVAGSDTSTTPPTARKGSTVTPELYGYSLYMPPTFQAFTRSSFYAPVRDITIDRGEAPDAERMTVLIDNSCPGNAVDALKRRAEIPLQLGDLDTNRCFFEGTCYQVVSGEAPANAPRTLRLEAAGMADNLTRMCWHKPPDFGIASLDKPNLPWYWTDVVKFCFEAAGFDIATQVVIEEEANWKFRLWADGGAGGNRGGNGVGAGHAQGGTPGQRWLPMIGAPIYEFLSTLIYEILGWHFYWDCLNHVWKVYKRPNPLYAGDASKFTPKCAFRGNIGPCGYSDSGVWTLAHRMLQIQSTRPFCSAIVLWTQWPSAQIATRAELKTALQAAADGDPHAEDPVIKMEMRRHSLTYWNPNCTKTDYTHPDFLGRERVRELRDDRLSTKDALEFVGKRLFYDNCFGRVYADWEADWGDAVTAALRKWDAVTIDSGVAHADEVWLIDRIEPRWDRDRLVRAHYRASLYRNDVIPPR